MPTGDPRRDMTAPRAVTDRDPEEVEILEALIDRSEEGMTVLELRASVDADIDAIEASLTELKQDGLIEVDRRDDTAVIRLDERVVPDRSADDEDASLFETIVDELRERLPF